jgi:hypothetical protein
MKRIILAIALLVAICQAQDAQGPILIPQQDAPPPSPKWKVSPEEFMARKEGTLSIDQVMTPSEKETLGITRLTGSEQLAFQRWLTRFAVGIYKRARPMLDRRDFQASRRECEAIEDVLNQVGRTEREAKRLESSFGRGVVNSLRELQTELETAQRLCR